MSLNKKYSVFIDSLIQLDSGWLVGLALVSQMALGLLAPVHFTS